MTGRRTIALVLLLGAAATIAASCEPVLIATRNATPQPVYARITRTTPQSASRSMLRLPLTIASLQAPATPTAEPQPRHGLPAAQPQRPSTTPTSPVLGRNVAEEPAGAAPGETGPPATPTNPWARLATCESGGRWDTNTGNGYYGGLQEDTNFWASYGDTAYARPDLAPAAAQIAAATKARDSGRGYSPWPVCSKKVGLR